MGDPVRAVRLLRGDPSSGIATLSSDSGTPGPGDPLIALAGRRHAGQARFDPSTVLRAQRRLRSFDRAQDRLRSGCALSLSKWQALLSKTLAKAACDTVCSEPPDLSLTDAAVLILADDPLQTVGQWCADSSQ